MCDLAIYSTNQPIFQIVQKSDLKNRQSILYNLRHSIDSLGKELNVKWNYVRNIYENFYVYDPRYLVFEYMQNLFLRRQQVELVNQLVTRDKNNILNSNVHKILMGGGKTRY